MTHYDALLNVALRNHGIVSSAMADELGLRTSEVTRYCHDGRIVRVGYGVYRIADYTPTRMTRYAAAVASVGEGAYVYGRSALTLCDLVPYEPGSVFVATTRRVRRALPPWVKLVRASQPDVCIEFGGIPSQPPATALASIADRLTPAELEDVRLACEASDILLDVHRMAVLAYLGLRVSHRWGTSSE